MASAQQTDTWRVSLLSYAKQEFGDRLGVTGTMLLGAAPERVGRFLRGHQIQHVEICARSRHLAERLAEWGMGFSYHAQGDEEADEFAELLGLGCSLIVIHPDKMDEDIAMQFENMMAVENLGVNHPRYRWAYQFDQLFESFPEMGLCLNVGHLWPAPAAAEDFIFKHGGRIRHIHVAETERFSGLHLPTVGGEFSSWARTVVKNAKGREKAVVVDPPATAGIAGTC